jgi:D-alanyl-D-alanine carboxypeptidase
MKLRRLAIAGAVILAGAAWCPAQERHALARQPEVAAALTVLDSWIAATVAQQEQPGLSVGIVYGEDLIWAKGYGFADVERRIPATPATVYRIASISKLFTATSIMQLRDQRKLRLDDPVGERLPWFSIKKTYQGGPPITIRHLITHTSGLPREVEGLNWSDLVYPAREELRKRVPGQETVFPPETEWKYSNLAASLAGEVVAAVSGEQWPQYVERHILRPLGMTATAAAPSRDMKGLAVGYGRRVPGRARDVEPFVDIAAEAPAGNMASTVEDLAKFVSLQFRDGAAGGRQILEGSTLREMHRVQWLRPDWQSGQGLGFSIRRAGGQVRVGHPGSLPGHVSLLELAPEDKLGVIVLANSNDGAPPRYVDQAFRLLTPAIQKATAQAKTRTADPAWQAYAGRYAWKHAEIQIQVLNGELVMISPDSDSPWEGRTLLEPVRPHTFRMVSPGMSYGPIGELLTFDVDGSGKVTRVRTPYSYWTPVQ